MKKIYAGIIGVLAVIAVVATSAYALFTDKVTMTGMVLGTATPNLQMSLDNTNWGSNFSIGNKFAPLVPGETDWGELYFQNVSNGTTDTVNMTLATRLTATGGDWSLLKDIIRMRVCVYEDGSAAPHCDPNKTTGYYTLAAWNASAITLPDTLLQSGNVHYVMEFFIPESYGNEIAGKKITDMAFEVTGTQIP